MSSFIWNHFNVCENESIAECKICKANIKRGSMPKTFSTTPLHRHMNSKHKLFYTRVKEEAGNAEKTAEPPKPVLKEIKLEALKKQTTLFESFSTKKLFDINDPKAKIIHQKILNMIALDNQPFTLTEDRGFIELMAHLQPKYMIPSRKYFTETMLPMSYKALQEAVMKEVYETQFLSFTSDIWSSSSSHESFISLTAHWITNEFEKKDCVLHCKHFPGSHTGINIAAAFESMLTEWKIETEKIHIILRDAAYNMQLGIELTGSVSMSCFIHQLQLVVKEALFSQRSVSDVIAKSKSISTHFNHSPLACYALKKIQIDLDPKLSNALLPIQDVQTRWNSTYLMLQRIETLKRSLQLYTADHVGKVPSLTANEWLLLEKTIRILQPFYIVTEQISKSKSMLSSVVSHVRALHKFLSNEQNEDSGVKTMKEELKIALEKRFLKKEGKDKGKELNIFESRQHIISCAIDPRYKLSLFPNELKYKASDWLLAETKEIAFKVKSKNDYDNESCEPGTDTDSDDKCPISQQIKPSPASTSSSSASDFLRLYLIENEAEEEGLHSKKKKRKLSGVDRKQEIENNIKKEIDVYSGGKTLSKLSNEDDVLNWWKLNKQELPYLSLVAKKFLSAPASSVYSERFFSEAGNVFEEKRSRLLPKTGEKLLFLHHNIPKFPNVLT